MARALAHAEKLDPRFADPAALALLGAPARARAERLLSRTMPRRPRALLEAVHLHSLSRGMVARTVAIDDAIRGATSTQLVILGAGLDGRAWRMPELAGAVVFEIDHPDTQREKQARAAELRRVASEVHFVPVDFERDDLAAALDEAGHDPSQPTTWVWEGVVMYLSLADVEATLAIIARLSAPGSRLVICYHSPALILHIVGAVVRRVGEPLRSVFSADEMRALLARYDFSVVRDQDARTIGATLSPDVARATRHMSHMRIVTADRLR